MDQQAIIAEIERRAKAVNLNIGQVCQRANVHPTTFSRWKKTDKNPKPTSAGMGSIEKLTDILDAEEARLAKVCAAAVAQQAAA